MSNIDGDVSRPTLPQTVVATAVQLHQTVKMKMTFRSRLDHSSSSELKRKRNQETTIVCQGKRKSSPSSDDPPKCSVTPVYLFCCACHVIEHVITQYMASFMSTATSTQPGPMCACGYGHCVVKISRSAKNPGRAYYQCPRGVPCVNWIGWCDEYGRQTAAENDRDNGRRFEARLIDIEQSLRVDKECCKFRTKRLEHEELMRRVFTGAAATGKNAWTPGEMRNQLEVEGESDSADFSTDSNELGASETANLMKSANITASGSGSKKRHSSVTAVQKKRITGAEALATSMDDLVNSVKTQSKELTVNHVVGGQSVAMAEAIRRLYEIQGLEQTNPLLHFGISLMEVPNNREMVMSIPSDEGIIGWLQVKQQDKERTTAAPTLASILRSQGLRF
ncbi:hypothetical protein TEA_019385 [Camellia sinensis var. sinensis]|uniref:GRF-type domain-containing protein n=1 Tax=Camellia sinensis var. sinensis TaxID=542762 RepID=A0A4V3WP50_CAMSN|nr:hypothetical protein TEA_019385 [Camellia sinensis var. sinensis]